MLEIYICGIVLILYTVTASSEYTTSQKVCNREVFWNLRKSSIHAQWHCNNYYYYTKHWQSAISINFSTNKWSYIIWQGPCQWFWRHFQKKFTSRSGLNLYQETKLAFPSHFLMMIMVVCLVSCLCATLNSQRFKLERTNTPDANNNPWLSY